MPAPAATRASASTAVDASVVASFDRVHKSFGSTVALDEVSLQVHRGDALGLLGPNGAGKTTLISVLTGLRTADSGQARLFGGDPRDPASRLRLGVTPQATGVPNTLRVREVVELVAAHYPDPADLDTVLEDYHLKELAHKQTGALSGGQQRRLLVALALVGRPELLILDEPTAGLDVQARDSLWAGLRRYCERGGTLVVTSHYLAEIEALAHRVVVMDQGRVIADGTTDQIRSHVAVHRVSMTLDNDARLPELAGLPGVLTLEGEGSGRPDDRVVLSTRDADACVRALVRQEFPFRDLEVHRASLEEAFLLLTGTPDRPTPRSHS